MQSALTHARSALVGDEKWEPPETAPDLKRAAATAPDTTRTDGKVVEDEVTDEK